jgi:signal transduction histidine kinase
MQVHLEKHPSLPAATVHALRTPLAALVAALDVASLAPIDSGTREEALSVARRQAVKLAGMIEQLDPARQAGDR